MKSFRKQLDGLWAEAVKLRAGYKSEISGTPGRQIGGDAILDAHHIAKKPNYTLRYNLDNGICVTRGEHRSIHGPDEEVWRRKIKHIRGENIYDELALLRYNTMKDKTLCRIYLENEIKKLKNEAGK